MKVGTRLTLVLLAVLTPVVAVYTYWSVTRSTRIYIQDLRRETRATTRALRPALEWDLRKQEWEQAANVLQRMSTDGTLGALFSSQGKPLHSPFDFPPELVLAARQSIVSDADGFVEFEQTAAGRRWFCRLVPLNLEGEGAIAYLLVAQDWTNIAQDLQARTASSVVAALLVMGLIAAIIPLLVRRYVSNPLSELSDRVTRLSREEDGERDDMGGDEVKLITEEFRRLDHQLTRASADLAQRHRRALDLERRLQHADRLATIGTLASGLAHEIGTPMGVIRARAEYLLRSKPTAIKLEEGLEIIISQIDRVSRIVRMLLDYARRGESIRALADLRGILRNALVLVESEAARRNVKLITDIGDRPLTVECDAAQLQQVFVNLAVNALDAMVQTNGGTLRIVADEKTTDDDGAGRQIARVTFADTGPGVSPQDRARLFDPFFTTKEPGKGTGMGLAVSQSIMRDHGGDIGFESGPDGTRFFVTIPAASRSSACSDRRQDIPMLAIVDGKPPIGPPRQKKAVRRLSK